MSNTYLSGSSVRMYTKTGFKDSAGTLTDPTTVSLIYRAPDGTETTITYAGGGVTKDSTGVYHADVTCSVVGDWYYRFVGTGAAVAVDEEHFTITPVFS